MGALKYTIIKTEEQYENYCVVLEELIQKDDSAYEDEIELFICSTTGYCHLCL